MNEKGESTPLALLLLAPLPGGRLCLFRRGPADPPRPRRQRVAGHPSVQLPGGREHQPQEQRARPPGPRLELGVELRRDEKGVPLGGVELDNLHPLARLVLPDEAQPRLLQGRDHARVDLVPVPVPLVDEAIGLVEPRGHAVDGLERGPARAEAHRAALVRRRPLGHEDDGGVRRGRLELGGVGLGEVEDVAGVLDDGELNWGVVGGWGWRVGKKSFEFFLLYFSKSGFFSSSSSRRRARERKNK